MKLLLDTHVVIWWGENSRISAAAREGIRDADQVFVSPVSTWEIAIKTGLGKLAPSRPVVDAILEAGFEELPIQFRHTQVLQSLPRHHSDPFDRMLVSQAMAEGLVLVSRDPVFKAYGVNLISA